MYLLLVVDGDGLSELVALFILTDEVKAVIESIMFSKSIMKRGQKNSCNYVPALKLFSIGTVIVIIA